MTTNVESPISWWRWLLEWPQRWLERHDARVVLTLGRDGPLTGRQLKAMGVLKEWNCYSVLHSLERRGFVTSELVDHEKPPQRVYRLRAD